MTRCSPGDKSDEQNKSSSVLCCPSPVTFGAAIRICKIVICTLTLINSETYQGSKVTAQLPATTVTKEQFKRFFPQTRQYIWIIYKTRQDNFITFAYTLMTDLAPQVAKLIEAGQEQ